MKYTLKLTIIVLFLHSHYSFSQTIPSYRLTDWSRAGVRDTITRYVTNVNITDFGGAGDGVTLNDTPFINAVTSMSGKPGIVFFPTGNYAFQHGIYLRDSLIVKGEPGSILKFMLTPVTTSEHMVNITGAKTTSIWNVAGSIAKNDTTISLDNTTGLQVGDWVMLYGNDTAIIASSWAYGSTGQIVQIKNIAGSTIIIDEKIRRYYSFSLGWKIRKLLPIKGAGVECLQLWCMDSSNQQTANIDFNYAVDCWVVGIESFMTNFAHVEVDNSAHLTIKGSYFHDSHGYGGSGRGYGIAMEYTSGDCLIEDNYFKNLRHSMLVQAGANGNVFSYNHSDQAYWTEPPFPTDAAGDIVCHGNYAYMNLFEGNIVQNIIVDNSHGINGPFNTFFRNRAELYGIVMNTGPATDSNNFVGNEITCTASSKGNYILAGNGNFEWGNNIQGTITPASTTLLPERSLYRNQTTVPGYWSGTAYPNIGTPAPYNAGTLTAGNLYNSDCRTNIKDKPLGISEANVGHTISVFPNPANNIIAVLLPDGIESVEILNVVGQAVYSNTYHSGKTIIDISSLSPGLYIIRVNKKYVQKFVKQ